MGNLLGETIGHYRILRQIGQGGMATVYLVYDERLHREVALKIIRREAFGEEELQRLQQRFEREARSLAKLNHPNIVKVFEYGEHNGSPYLVMEYVSGKTLKEKSKPLTIKQSIKIVKKIAFALEHAHQNGILHRDVKPSNILLSETGEPKLADFGIAKLIIESEGEYTLTRTGTGVGTPEYMAPEQGLGQEVKAQADIYSLGVVFYELITGHKPFTADTPMAVIIKQVNDSVPSPRLINPNLNIEIEQVLYKALAKNPADRFTSMGEFCHILEQIEMEDIPKNLLSTQKTTNIRQIDQATHDSLKIDEPTSSDEQVQSHATPNPRIVKQNILTPKTSHNKVLFPVLGLLILGSGIFFIIYGVNQNKPLPIQPNKPAIATNIESAPKEEIDDQKTTDSSLFTSLEQSFDPDVIQLNNVVELAEMHRWENEGQLFVSWFPDSKKFLAARSLGYGYSIYDLEKLSKDHYRDEMRNIYMKTFSPDGTMYVTEDRDYNLSIWQQGTEEELIKLEGKGGFSLHSPIFSPDNKYLAGLSDEALVFWDMSSGRKIVTLDNNIPYAPGGSPDLIMSFSPDGKYFAAGNSYSGEIKIWEVQTTEIMSIIHWHEGVMSICFSPDGKTLASGGINYDSRDFIRFWNVTNGKLVSKIQKSNEKATSIAYSLDGQLLASGSDTNIVRIWTVRDGSLAQTINVPNDYFYVTVSFSPNGKWLLTSGKEMIMWGIQRE